MGIRENIAARKQLGMDCRQYESMLAERDANLKRERQRAIDAALRAGLYGTEADVAAAVAECKRLGVA